MHRPARDPRQTESASSAGDRRATRVCAYALCRRDTELLLVRASANTEVEGTWFLPGGGLAYGEAPEEAVLRELTEETGLTGRDPVLLDVLCDVRERSSGGTIFTVRVIYVVDHVRGELRREHDGTTDEVRWVRTDELGELDLSDYVLRAVELSAEK